MHRRFKPKSPRRLTWKQQDPCEYSRRRHLTMQKKKNRAQLLDEALPQFEHFIESRESYIKALEATIDVLKRENQQFTKSSMAIRSSIDELVAMQRLSSSISTGVNAEQIV